MMIERPSHLDDWLLNAVQIWLVWHNLAKRDVEQHISAEVTCLSMHSSTRLLSKIRRGLWPCYIVFVPFAYLDARQHK